jgi:hypothetical protein
LPDGLTLHSLRRTYASLLFAIGRTAPEVMAQLGHADARLTLRIYAQAMSQEPGERERLQAVVDGGSLGTKRHWSQSADADVPLGDDLLASESAEFAATSSMEPDGIEPSTSCLQSRRSEVFLVVFSPCYGVLGALGAPKTSRVGNTLGNTAVRLMT